MIQTGIGIGIKMLNGTLRKISKTLSTRENIEGEGFNADNLIWKCLAFFKPTASNHPKKA